MADTNSTSMAQRGEEAPDGKRPSKRSIRRFKVRYGLEGLGATGFTNNFSEGGLYLQTTGVIRVGTMLRLEVHAPGRTFDLQATVIWTRKPRPNRSHAERSGLGLKLIDPGEAWIEFCKQQRAAT